MSEGRSGKERGINLTSGRLLLSVPPGDGEGEQTKYMSLQIEVDSSPQAQYF